MKKIFTPQVVFVILLVVAAGASRLIKIAPNIHAVGAMALFAGAYFQNRKLAYAVPLITMFIPPFLFLPLRGLHLASP